MRTYRGVVVVLSVVFLLFSAVMGARYDKLRKDRDSIGRYNYGISTPEQDARDQAEHVRIDGAQERIHSIVKPVSMTYYLMCLSFFVRAWGWSPSRKTAILGAVASLVMTVWSVGIDGGVSFDEVYPAWIVAALVLPALSMVVLPAKPAAVEAAA